jgi:hypothetical protein
LRSSCSQFYCTEACFGAAQNASDSRLHKEPAPYLPFAICADALERSTLVVETAGDPAALAKATRQTLKGLDLAAMMIEMTTLRQHMQQTLALDQLTVTVSSGLGVFRPPPPSRRIVRRYPVCGESPHSGDRSAHGAGCAIRRDQVRKYPGRFRPFRGDSIARQGGTFVGNKYVLDTLTAGGIALLTTYDSKHPGDPSFALVFEELNRRSAVVFFHPTVVACCASTIPAVRPQVIEFPFDTPAQFSACW